MHQEIPPLNRGISCARDYFFRKIHPTCVFSREKFYCTDEIILVDLGFYFQYLFNITQVINPIVGSITIRQLRLGSN
jgi:hypothetical protein